VLCVADYALDLLSSRPHVEPTLKDRMLLYAISDQNSTEPDEAKVQDQNGDNGETRVTIV
jgi:nucleoid-associated protein YejK